MAKKIRFPLKLSEGAEARTLDELREHFDLQAILEYYKSGKLLTWLEDRYLEGEAEAIQALDESAPDFQRRLCEIFQVEYTGDDVDLEVIERRQERLRRLRSITDDAEYIQNIDRVAFDQEELADLLDEGEEKIYLCGEHFTVPASRKGVTYVGINNPTVHISGKVLENAAELGIEFVGVECDNLPQYALDCPLPSELEIPEELVVPYQFEMRLRKSRIYRSNTQTTSMLVGNSSNIQVRKGVSLCNGHSTIEMSLLCMNNFLFDVSVAMKLWLLNFAHYDLVQPDSPNFMDNRDRAISNRMLGTHYDVSDYNKAGSNGFPKDLSTSEEIIAKQYLNCPMTSEESAIFQHMVGQVLAVLVLYNHLRFFAERSLLTNQSDEFWAMVHQARKTGWFLMPLPIEDELAAVPA